MWRNRQDRRSASGIHWRRRSRATYCDCVVMGRGVLGMFAARGSVCMVCGVDLWDVERYVSVGAVVMCQSCVDALMRAVDDADGTGEIEVALPALPPRVYGSVPDEEAAAAIARAFTRTFDSDFDQFDAALD